MFAPFLLMIRYECGSDSSVNCLQ